MFKKILVGSDGSETATRAVQTAAELARSLGAELHIVTGYRPDAMRTSEHPDDYLQRVAEGPEAVHASIRSMLEPLGVRAEFHSASGDPAEAIVRTADQVGADLIVVGNRGMKGVRRVLGSVPNTVAHSADCSVMIVDTAEAG